MIILHQTFFEQKKQIKRKNRVLIAAIKLVAQ